MLHVASMTVLVRAGHARQAVLPHAHGECVGWRAPQCYALLPVRASKALPAACLQVQQPAPPPKGGKRHQGRERKSAIAQALCTVVPGVVEAMVSRAAVRQGSAWQQGRACVPNKR